MAVLPRIRTLAVDRTGTLRPAVFAALAVLGVRVALGLAWTGGRPAVVGIATVEAVTAAALVWLAGRR